MSEKDISKSIEEDWQEKKILEKDYYGFFLKEHKNDFEIRVYDLKNGKNIGSASFFINDNNVLKKYINISDKETYMGDINISKGYQGRGLSKILLDESFNELKRRNKAHIALIYKKKGVERLMKRFLDEGYMEKTEIKKVAAYKHITVLYKEY